LSSDDFDDLGTIFWLSVFDNMLDDIVSVGIGDEHGGTLMQLFENIGLVVRFAIFKNPLDDSAAVWMACQDMDLASKGFDDKLDMFSWNTLDSFLNNVVSILIFHALENISLKFCDKLSLLVSENMLEGLISLAYALYFHVWSPTFCTTLQPYICIERAMTWFFICSAKTLFCT
jgi:hypothetical protein